jgi:molybdenum cofactor cytidylyltransferase/nicotine blue oxidoreductase
MSASLRAGLAALTVTDAEAAVVSLVDLPDVGPDVVRRLLDPSPGRATLRRASYDGQVGHPVVIGRDHWTRVADETSGDRGARGYLATHPVEVVECGDLATGRDVDSR